MAQIVTTSRAQRLFDIDFETNSGLLGYMQYKLAYLGSLNEHVGNLKAKNFEEPWFDAHMEAAWR